MKSGTFEGTYGGNFCKIIVTNGTVQLETDDGTIRFGKILSVSLLGNERVRIVHGIQDRKVSVIRVMSDSSVLLYEMLM